MIVCLRPLIGRENPYINIIRDGLTNNGVTTISLNDIVKYKFLFNRIDAAIFNWYENVSGSSEFLKLLVMIKKKLIVTYLKQIKKTKIIIILHNKSDHNENNSKSRRMQRWLLSNSDKIVIHCYESLKYIKSEYKYDDASNLSSRCVYIPHPNYIDAYDKKTFSKFVSGDEPDVMRLLYFGRVKKYKNAEILIGLAERLKNKKVHITIAGEIDAEIVDNFNNISNMANLIVYNQRIPDDTIWGMIENSDCVVLPYDIESVLNSGSVILTLSVGKNIICPEIGTIMDFPKELPYCYNYASKEEHLDKLYEKTMKAFYDFQNNRDYFYSRANALHEIVKEQYSKERVAELFYEMLKTTVYGDND